MLRFNFFHNNKFLVLKWKATEEDESIENSWTQCKIYDFWNILYFQSPLGLHADYFQCEFEIKFLKTPLTNIN